VGKQTRWDCLSLRSRNDIAGDALHQGGAARLRLGWCVALADRRAECGVRGDGECGAWRSLVALPVGLLAGGEWALFADHAALARRRRSRQRGKASPPTGGGVRRAVQRGKDGADPPLGAP